MLQFRGTRLSDDQLKAFSRNFGLLDKRPMGKAVQNLRLGNHYVTVISNVIANGRPIGGLGNRDAQWHADISYNPSPAVASILHAWLIPAEGDNTYFCNMYAALEGLSAALRERIEGSRLKYDAGGGPHQCQQLARRLRGSGKCQGGAGRRSSHHPQPSGDGPSMPLSWPPSGRLSYRHGA